jgi:hypothetical protein
LKILKGVGGVAQTMYTHVSKCKNNEVFKKDLKERLKKKEAHLSRGVTKIRNFLASSWL